jgi:hypothetical protein
MATNITKNQNNNNNPLWVVMLLLFIWLMFFTYKLYNTM